METLATRASIDIIWKVYGVHVLVQPASASPDCRTWSVWDRDNDDIIGSGPTRRAAVSDALATVRGWAK